MSEGTIGEAIGIFILLGIIWQAFWHQMTSPVSASEVRSIVQQERIWGITKEEVRKIIKEELERKR